MKEGLDSRENLIMKDSLLERRKHAWPETGDEKRHGELIQNLSNLNQKEVLRLAWQGAYPLRSLQFLIGFRS